MEIKYATDLLIFAIDDKKNDNCRELSKKKLSILLVKRNKEPYKNKWCLPGGFIFDGETSLIGAKRILKKETNLENFYLEQLKTFDDIDRDPRGRIISTAYISLVDKKMIKQSNDYTGNRDFAEKDTLKVPYLKIKQMKKYPELCNKTIAGTDFYFSEVLETIDLVLDEKGGKIKSEAAILVKTNSLIITDENKPRHFDFDKPYVMFLVDEGKNDPYFALRVKDLKGLQ